jgi:hypothetical protein
VIEVVRQHIGRVEPITLDLARDMVQTAHDIIERMDGRRMTEVERQNVLSDALDLAFYVTGEPQHLNAEGIEARARMIAGC